MTPNVLHSSAHSQHFTPPEIIAPVSAFYCNSSEHHLCGASHIDLDPASCELANSIVRAYAYYDGTHADGLTSQWVGKCYLNPPYSKKDGGPVEPWITKAIEEYKAGAEVVMLLNSATGAKWFGPLWSYPIVFIDGRVSFCQSRDSARAAWEKRCGGDLEKLAKLDWNATLKAKAEGLPDGIVRMGAPTHYNVLVGLTKRLAKFADAFRELGRIWWPALTTSTTYRMPPWSPYE